MVVALGFDTLPDPLPAVYTTCEDPDGAVGPATLDDLPACDLTRGADVGGHGSTWSSVLS